VIKYARISDKVLMRTQLDCCEDNLSKVRGIVNRLVLALKADDFAYSEEQEYAVPIFADIYATKNAHGTWFIKFFIEHGRVTVASCHAPDRDIKRVDGRTIKAP